MAKAGCPRLKIAVLEKRKRRAVGSVRPEALQSTGAKALPPEARWIADLSSEGDGPKMGPEGKDGPRGHSDQNDPKPRPRAGPVT